MRRRIANKHSGWIVMLGIFLSVAGCATMEQPKFTEILWPEPPQTPRIKFVGLLRNQDDLGRGGGEIFLDTLVGRKEHPLSLLQPMALALSRNSKRLYVSDYSRQRVFVFDFEAHRVSFLGGALRGFKKPLGIAVDDRDNVYVVDSEQRLVRVFDAEGKFLRNIVHDLFERPTGIAVDAKRRRIYVIDSAHRDSQNHMLHIMDMEEGVCLKHLGGLGNGEAQFFFATNVAVDDDGKVYVTDTLNARVQVFDPEGRYLREFGARGDTIGRFAHPKGVAVDSFGNLYVVDSTWSNVQIFNQRAEVLLYFAGRGVIPGLLFNPNGIAIDKENRIYVADTFNSRVAIYQLINTKAEDSYLSASRQPEKGGDAAKAEKRETSPGRVAKK